MWHQDHYWVERVAWIIGTLACIILQHGKLALRYLSQMLRSMSFGARRAARFFEGCHRNWDEWTSDRNRKKTVGRSEDGDSAIKENSLSSLKPVFPTAVLVTLTVTGAAAIAALIVGAGESTRPVPERIVETKIQKSKEKEDRLEIKSSFADRFIVSGDCSACGGPIVELMPMPKPNPLRSRNALEGRSR